ncbi:hypothetical protein [Bifidobacterium actinocoloniiforme]|nr:hypothetical protein [Bifidobacterium actinocoloniiforme]
MPKSFGRAKTGNPIDKLKYLQEGMVPSSRQAGAASLGPRPSDGPAPPQPPLVLTPAVACDPETDPAVLWYIARELPELRRWLAANPRASPELLEAISQLGGPGVKQALGLLMDYLDKRRNEAD